jgi:hypothetical protein
MLRAEDMLGKQWFALERPCRVFKEEVYVRRASAAFIRWEMLPLPCKGYQITLENLIRTTLFFSPNKQRYQQTLLNPESSSL